MQRQELQPTQLSAGVSITYRQPEPGLNSAHHARSSISRRMARVHRVARALGAASWKASSTTETHPPAGGAGFRITAESAGSVSRTENSRSCEWTSSARTMRAGVSAAKPPYRLALLSNSRV